MKSLPLSISISAVILLMISCTSKTEVSFNVEIIPNPSKKESTGGNLNYEGGKLYLTWIEEGDSSTLLRSVWSGQEWGETTTLARGKNWFVNWADFPDYHVNNNFPYTQHAHFLAKSDSATFSYDIQVVSTRDEGKTWSQPVKLHSDTVKGEHGFLSFVSLENGNTGAVWLDGRNATGGHGGHGSADGHGGGAMTLRFGEITERGEILSDTLLDDRICDCCQTSATQIVGRGQIFLYRNRTEDEIRDIWMVKRINKVWQKPEPFSNDGWEIAGCPVNGPVITSWDNTVAGVWFTGANGQSKVKARISTDAGDTFGQPFEIDLGNPIGRVDAKVLSDGNLAVSWLETIENATFIMLGKFSPTGERLLTEKVAEVAPSRKTGFPRMGYADGTLMMMWKDTNTGTLTTAIITP